MARADFAFAHRIRVRYSEVDLQGVLNNARYLDYADIVFTEYLRERLGTPDDFEVHVANARIDFRKPIRNDELVDGLLRVDRFGTSSMTTIMELHGADAEDLRATVTLVYVLVESSGGTPVRIPDHLRDLLR